MYKTPWSSVARLPCNGRCKTNQPCTLWSLRLAGQNEWKMDEKEKKNFYDCLYHNGTNSISPTTYSVSWKIVLVAERHKTYVYLLQLKLIRSKTLKYWFVKDLFTKIPANIMWKDSRLARKRSVMGLRRSDTKLLCN